MFDDLFAAKGRAPFSEWEWWRKVRAVLMFVVGMGAVAWAVPTIIRMLPMWAIYAINLLVFGGAGIVFAINVYRQRKWIRLREPKVRSRWIDWRFFLAGLGAMAAAFATMHWVSGWAGLWMLVALSLAGTFFAMRDERRLDEERRAANIENLMAYTLEDEVLSVDRDIVGEHDLDLWPGDSVNRLAPSSTEPRGMVRRLLGRRG